MARHNLAGRIFVAERPPFHLVQYKVENQRPSCGPKGMGIWKRHVTQIFVLVVSLCWLTAGDRNWRQRGCGPDIYSSLNVVHIEAAWLPSLWHRMKRCDGTIQPLTQLAF
jgi:hypothetical protein